MRRIYRRRRRRRRPTASTSPPTSRAHGARRVHVAPQAVDDAFWCRAGAPAPALATKPFVALFVGRDVPEKGLARRCERRGRAAAAPDGELVGRRRAVASPRASCATSTRPQTFSVVPSLPTRPSASRGGWSSTRPCTREPRSSPRDEVGAAAGGLVRHERNGLVVPAGDAAALAGALRRAADDPRCARALGPPRRARRRAVHLRRVGRRLRAALAEVGAC